MNAGRTIFSQLMDFLPRDEFHRCVQRYNGNHKIQTFSCFDQYLCMAFAQLTGRESLRDIEACLRTFGPDSITPAFGANESPATPWPTPTTFDPGKYTPTSRNVSLPQPPNSMPIPIWASIWTTRFMP